MTTTSTPPGEARRALALLVTAHVDRMTQAHADLEAEGFEVIVASDAATADQVARFHRPGLAVVDPELGDRLGADLRTAGVEVVRTLTGTPAISEGSGVTYQGDWIGLGDLRLNPEEGIVLLDTRRLDVSAVAFDVLELLMYAEGAPIPVHELAHRLGDVEVTEVDALVLDLIGTFARAGSTVLVAITAEGVALSV